MHFIVESARDVANAAGVAIGLLKGDRLTYRAGSGSSAAFVGQYVTASLTVSAFTKTSREILRVEDAHKDTRIEADICRQFGANSLLMLPIYFDHGVAGILDIRFNQAHTFQDREVRAYRLMAEQIEGALSHSVQNQPHDVARISRLTPQFLKMFCSNNIKKKTSKTPLGSGWENPASPLLRTLPILSHFRQKVASIPTFCCPWDHPRAASEKFSRRSTREILSAQAEDETLLEQQQNPPLHQSSTSEIPYTCEASAVWDGPPSPPHSGVGIGRGAGRFHRTHCLQAPQSRILVGVLHAAEIYGTRPAGNRRQASSRQNSCRARTHTRESPQWDSHSQACAARRERSPVLRRRCYGSHILPKPAAKRSVAPKGRVTHFGNDVTVRYFTSPQPTVRPVSR